MAVNRPAILKSQTAGAMSRSIVVEALIRTTLWGVDHRLGQLAGFVKSAVGARKAG